MIKSYIIVLNTAFRGISVRLGVKNTNVSHSVPSTSSRKIVLRQLSWGVQSASLVVDVVKPRRRPVLPESKQNIISITGDMLASSVITNAPDSYSTHRDNDDNVEESSILNFSSDLNFNVSYDECHIHVEENGAPFLDKITLEKISLRFWFYTSKWPDCKTLPCVTGNWH